MKDDAKNIWNRYKNKPLSKVTVENLKDKLPQVRSSSTSDQLTYKINLEAHKIPS